MPGFVNINGVQYPLQGILPLGGGWFRVTYWVLDQGETRQLKTIVGKVDFRTFSEIDITETIPQELSEELSG